MKQPDGGRRILSTDVAVASGFAVEIAATDLTFPTGLAFAPNGDLYIAEMGQRLRQPTVPARIVQVTSDGSLREVASGFNGALTALAFHHGSLYVAESDSPARIVRVGLDGTRTVLVGGLPGGGDHPTGGIAFSPDGHMYFAQGTLTNSGVVGVDNFDVGWLAARPDAKDVPGQDITLTGHNCTTRDPLVDIAGEKAITGGFVPFDTETSDDTRIRGNVKCSGSILRATVDGDFLHLVAWGLRDAFGLAFSPDGRLFCTENGFENRGSRPVKGDVDRLWEVKAEGWYGWPDFAAGEPLTDPKFRPEKGPALKPLIKNHPSLSGAPLVRFPALCGVARFDFCPPGRFGFEAQAFVALSGDRGPQVPALGSASNGNRVVRIDVNTGQMDTFAANRHDGPASSFGEGGLERPVDARFDPQGEALYVLDYGLVEVGPGGPRPVEGSGVLWRVWRPRFQTTGFRGPA